MSRLQTRAEEAQARARIERSRRRLVVVSAAAVLLMAGLAGASWLGIAQDGQPAPPWQRKRSPMRTACMSWP